MKAQKPCAKQRCAIALCLLLFASAALNLVLWRSIKIEPTDNFRGLVHDQMRAESSVLSSTLASTTPTKTSAFKTTRRHIGPFDLTIDYKSLEHELQFLFYSG